MYSGVRKFPCRQWTVSNTFRGISRRLYAPYILSTPRAGASASRCSSGAVRLNSHLVLTAFKPFSSERGGNASDVEIIHYIWSFMLCQSRRLKILQYFQTVRSAQRTSKSTSDRRAYVSLSGKRFSTPPGPFLCLHCRCGSLSTFYIQIRAGLVLTVKYAGITVCEEACLRH